MGYTVRVKARTKVTVSPEYEGGIHVQIMKACVGVTSPGL